MRSPSDMLKKLGTMFRLRSVPHPEPHHQSLIGEEDGFVICGEVDPIPLVQAMARSFSGRGHLMIEGELPEVNTGGLATSAEVPSPLTRHTVWSWPKERVLVVDLAPETINEVCSVLIPSAFSSADFTHVQIEREGRLEFGAYDSFEVAWCSRRIEEAVLDKLHDNGLIGGYALVNPNEPWPC